MFRYFKYFDYYLEVLAKRIGGRGLTNPRYNGEYKIIENIVKNSNGSLCFMDGGSNIGDHIAKFDSFCKKHKVTDRFILAVEPFPATIEVLKKNLSDVSYELIEKALGKEKGIIKFYSDSGDGMELSGQNSAIKHYYLNDVINVEQTTIDSIVNHFTLQKIDFLKLDIEGYEYNALLGAQKTLSLGLIDYIQLEYNQTWIEGGGSIKKILDLANAHSYHLYRIRKNDLLSIPRYDFNLDDFFYCNLLLVRNGCSLPLPSTKKAIPLI
ncbi:FkbM family methyltransferase [Gammaproteobacteria bacterium]|nr:FkbM family methyltransferase [Gammaproteobacteria bacterium]|tara:strand:- start:1683 stop:2483 length:801 start_codon:yes stop_codon:yes gene_type:complete